MRKLLAILAAVLLMGGCTPVGDPQAATTLPTRPPESAAVTRTPGPTPEATPAETPAPTPTPLPSAQPGYIDTQDGDGVNLRSQPSSASDDTIIGTLEEGAAVRIVDQKDGWATILLDDGTLAYVNLDFVRLGEKPPEPKHPYYIYVEKGSFTINVYGLDENNEHTVLLHSWRTAIGQGSMTPTGKFRLGKRYEWKEYNTGSSIRYATKFHGSLYIHGPLYSRQDKNHMYNDQYREIGTKATRGCLRTTSYAAWWIYEHCEEGTIVEIVNGSPRGTSSEDPPRIETSHLDPTESLIGT